MPYSFGAAADYLTEHYLPKRQRRAQQDDENANPMMGAAFDLGVTSGQQRSSDWRTKQQAEAHLPPSQRSYTGPPGWSPMTGQEYASSAGGDWQKKRTFPQAGIYKGYGSQQMIQR